MNLLNPRYLLSTLLFLFLTWPVAGQGQSFGFLDANGNEVREARVVGLLDAHAFLKKIEQARK